MPLLLKARNCYLRIRPFLWIWLIVCFIVGMMLRRYEITQSMQFHSFNVQASVKKLDKAQEKTLQQEEERTTPVVVKENSREYRMIFMEGWIEEEFFYNSDLILSLPDYSPDQCGYYCTSFKIGEAKRSLADIVVFQPSTLKLIPPKKLNKQYWVLNSFEELTNEEIAHYYRLGYDKLIDNVIVSPFYAQPFMTFDKVFSRKEVASIEINMHEVKMAESSAYVPKVLQLKSECNYNKQTVKFADGVKTLGHRLNGHQNINVTFEYYCFGSPGGTELFNNKPWFIIIDETACKSSQIDQLISILKSNIISIPVIRTTELTFDEIVRITPPNSVIVVEKSDSTKQLIDRLTNIVTKPSLFNEYTKWRSNYVFKPTNYYNMRTDQDESVLLRICQLCRLAAETPTTKINSHDEKCFDV